MIYGPEPAFIAAAKDSLSDLVACSKSTNSAALIPAPYIVDNMLHNCAILLHKGRMECAANTPYPMKAYSMRNAILPQGHCPPLSR